MRIAPSFWQDTVAAGAAVLLLCLASACKPQVVPSGPPKTASVKTNVVAAVTNHPSTDNLSVFLDLMPPKGRDPFFPNSHRRDPAAPLPTVVAKPPPEIALLLQGLSGPPNNRVAIIGGGIKAAILQVGESGTVRLPGGSVHLKCTEIGEDYAVVLVNGEKEKRLELTKKGK